MVYTAYTFMNVFQYQPDDIYWCTADIGWITGHSYMLYGPLACGATSLHFEEYPLIPNGIGSGKSVKNIKSPSFIPHPRRFVLWRSIPQN